MYSLILFQFAFYFSTVLCVVNLLPDDVRLNRFSNLNACEGKDGMSNRVAWEWKCLRDSNTLQDIMDAIKINYQQDYLMCRNFDDGITNDAEEFYRYRPKAVNNQLCILPREILTTGTAGLWNIYRLGIHGAIQACPEWDPDFLNCLCELQVSNKHLSTLASYFRPGKVVPQCAVVAQNQQKPQKPQRATLSARDIEALTLVNSTTITKQLDARDSDGFYVDSKGRPAYTAGTVGYKLPYYDQEIWNGRGARRCYIHPEKAEEHTCRTWRMTASVTGTRTLQTDRPFKATFSAVKAIEDEAAATSIADAEPEIAEEPSETLYGSAERAYDEAVMTATGAVPTPTSSGASRKFEILVLWLLLPIIAALDLL